LAFGVKPFLPEEIEYRFYHIPPVLFPIAKEAFFRSENPLPM